MWMPIAGPLPVPSWFGGGAQVGYVGRGAARERRPREHPHVVRHGALPRLRAGEAYWEISPLTDQGIAGMIMMIEGGLVTLGVLAWALLALGVARHGEAAAAGAGCRARRAARPRSAPSAPSRPATAPGSKSGSLRAKLVRGNRFLYLTGLHGRDRDPWRRDRGGAAAGAVLRRVDDRLGEHDRRRPGRALGRVLVRRQARRPLPGAAPCSAGGARRRRPGRPDPVRRPAVLRGRRSPRSTRSRPARSSAPCSPCSS